MTPPPIAFIVRVWFEREDALSGTRYHLRGSVQVTENDHLQYFQSVEQMAALLAELVEAERPAPHPAAHR